MLYSFKKVTISELPALVSLMDTSHYKYNINEKGRNVAN